MLSEEKKKNILNWAPSALVALIWLCGAIQAILSVTANNDTPPLLLQVKAVVILYVLFLFEAGVSYMDVMLKDDNLHIAKKALRSLTLFAFCTGIFLVILIIIIQSGLAWPLGVMVIIVAVEKYDVEMFKKDEASYFESSAYIRVD